MIFFRIRHSIDGKIIGRKYPQVEKVFIPTQWDDKLFIQSYVNREAPSNVLLPSPVLYKSAKVTDLLSASAVGLSLNLLISNRLKKIIEASSTLGIQFFHVDIVHLNNEYSYWILHPYNFLYEQLYLEKSTIGYYKDLSIKNLDHSFKPEDAFALAKEIDQYDNALNLDIHGNKFLFISEIVFKTSHTADFFPLRCISGGTGFFVSQKLKTKIEGENCTGIVFTQPNEVYP